MFDTNPRLLSKLLDDVESAKMQLPDFQRGWVWDDNRIKGLLASISRGFPIGAVMTLEGGGELRLKSRPVEGVEASDRTPDSYLLDGQQRLTSLYQALRHPDPVYTSEKSRSRKVKRWYFVDMQAALDPTADREDAIVSVSEDKKQPHTSGGATPLDLSSDEKEYEQHFIPTEALLDSQDWLLGYVQYWAGEGREHPIGTAADFFKEFKAQVQDNFSKYQLPVIELGKETPKEAVCTVFEKVNTGGVQLNVFELATASFAMDDSFSLRDDWKERQDRLYPRWGVLQGLQGDQFLQTIALLKTQDDRRRAEREGKTGRQLPAIGCRKGEILDLELEDYRHWADQVEEGFVEAAKFLRSQFVFGKGNVPYNTQLVPLAALFTELGLTAKTALARERLERWYWSGVFGELYGGAVETQFARDLVEVAEFIRSGAIPSSVNEANFVPQRLISLKTKNSAAYKGLYALQMKNNAADWMKAESLSFATYHDNGIDIHHIFPVDWCRKNGITQRDLYDSIINKTPIDAHTNRSIGGSAPSKYLERISGDVPEGRLDSLLRSHWLDPDHLWNDDFASSFVARGQKMLGLVADAMGRDLGNGQQAFIDALHRGGVGDLYEEEDPDYDDLSESDQEETEAA